MENNKMNIGCLNVRGCKEEYKRNIIVEDCVQNDLQVLGITETHITDNNLQNYSINGKGYLMYVSGEKEKKYEGVGIVVKQELNPIFKEISSRIYQCEIKLKDRKLVIIVAYAPTLKVSESNTDKRDQFYEELECTIKKVSKRNALAVIGDFNAKTGTGWKEFPDEMGKFGKGQMNSNGRLLLECMKANDMILTNTLFKHKLSQITTWEAPMRNKNSNGKPLLGPDGQPRRNPFRNQIDYIAVRKEHRRFVLDSKSTNFFQTDTDHRLVKMKILFQWFKIKNGKKKKQSKADLSNFSKDDLKEEYKTKLNELSFDKNNSP